MTAGMMLAWSSPIIPKLQELNDDNPLATPITDDEVSWIGALLPLGALFGPFPFAYLQGKIGRKFTLLLIAIPFIASYFVAAFAKVVGLFYLARILGGVGVGATFTCLPNYIAEVSEASIRGIMGASLSNFLSLGMIFTYTLGPYISITLFNVVEVLIPISMLLLFQFLPDSPYYLVAKNRRSEAEEVLMSLRCKSRSDIQKELSEIETGVMNYQKDSGTFLDIFKSKQTIKASIISVLLCMFGQLTGISIVLYYTQNIFEETGFSISSAVSPIIVGVAQFASSLITPLIVDRLGRKILLLSTMIGIIIAEIPLGLYFYLQNAGHSVEGISWIPLVTLIIFIVSYNSGIGPLAWVILSEIVPGNLRGVVSSMAASSSMVISFFTVFYFNSISNAIGMAGSFWICAGFAALCFFFTWFYVPETKGKTLQEIQEHLES